LAIFAAIRRRFKDTAEVLNPLNTFAFVGRRRRLLACRIELRAALDISRIIGLAARALTLGVVFCVLSCGQFGIPYSTATQ
jgi:hypothetical protein